MSTEDPVLKAHHPAGLFLLGYFGMLGTACLIALVAGGRRPRLIGGQPTLGNELIDPRPAWWIAFDEYPEYFKRITCKLDDGSIIMGILGSYSTALEEGSARDLYLTAPVSIRVGRVKKVYASEALIVSAARIVWILVEHVEKAELP